MNKIIAERYELIDIIGQGGMADVYLANDTILNRTIAIKILRTSLAKDPIYIARFQREASAAAALSHKNIVEIYDVGEDSDQYYIVMEYVPGRTLKELIAKRGALHVMEAIDIMKQVLSGTARAHQMGIIHRDLKPQNILVTDTGTAKIADFGIASIQSLTQFTQTDVIMGSLHYLAPELARGEKATVQSDIYALGIVFYELLRGQVPFNGESPVNIALKHMQEDLPSLREFNPSIPQSVENIIIKATAKNLNDRYKSATEMLEDLQTCLSRTDEEKLVFDHSDEVNDPTIVVNPRQIFDEEEPEEVEERAVEESVLQAGAKEVYLIEEPMAAAIGASLDVGEPSGNIIVDIGGGTTEVAVISLGGIVVSHSLRVAGDELDEDIVNYIKKEENLAIGETTAEQIKMQIGCAMPLMTETSMEIRGRDLGNGLPKNITVTSVQIEDAIQESINKIVEVVKMTLEKTPPELASDIMEKGIVLAGGGALIKNLDKLLSIETGMPVYVAEEPLDCVVRGAGKTLEDIERLKRVLVNARSRR